MVIISDLEGPVSSYSSLRRGSGIKEFNAALHLEFVLQPLPF